MNIFRKILYNGILSNIPIEDNLRIKLANLSNNVLAILLFLSGSAGLIFRNYLLSVIGFSGALLILVLAIIFSSRKVLRSKGQIGIFITSTAGLLIYYLEPELSTGILVLFMLLPIALISTMPRYGTYISLGYLAVIVALNITSPGSIFLPLSPTNLVLFIVAYCLMGLSSAIVLLLVQQRFYEQSGKLENIESVIKERDEFIVSLSHKLRTSLSNITLINNLVNDERMSSAQKELLDTLKNSTSDLIDDVNELVEIASPSMIDFKPSVLSFNLNHSLKGISDILSSDKSNVVKLKFNKLAELEYNVIGDSSLLRSVLINLIRSVSEIGLKKETIQLGFSKDYETNNHYGLKFQVEFELNDKKSIESALGQNKVIESHARIFSLSVRLLALIGSKPEYNDRGNEQVIYFFMDFPKDLTRKTERDFEDGKLVLERTGKSLEESSILLVEDNALNQKIVLLSLSRKVKSIDVANNGKEALDMFGTKKYDAILMDIQMPVMDGITATKKIREIESTSEGRVPIIAITAYALSGDRDNCLAAGADEYLSKPFQVEELISLISKLLNPA